MTSLTHVQRVRILYKTILKLHRGLPIEMQPLGNDYLRDEFKRHKSCNPAEAHVFMNEWANYALSLAEQLGLRGPINAKKLGKPLQEEYLQNMKDEQIHQLYELMLAANGIEDDKKLNNNS
ncbi:hypothetical protein HCN44_010510 [Aphidius gifuensis]|uniref:Succinate dehydrogenase assembly factor 3 n=1 Tax=Aphidius gifuensis TaxID=684658 RepID=A0A835CPC1_APHGI|nr:succinate dehydrogenase assembly factor 3, mitochondrial [Aphidius gifuensis]KAF7991709.1 hypothetical protein HCN44_010510 [Aphidius gifuensis]